MKMRIFGRGERKKTEGYPQGFWYKNPWDRYKEATTEGFCQGDPTEYDFLTQSHNRKPLILFPVETPEFHGEDGISPQAAPKISHEDYLELKKEIGRKNEKGIIDVESIPLDEEPAQEDEEYTLNIIPISAKEIEGREPPKTKTNVDENNSLFFILDEHEVKIPNDFLGKLYLACETSYQEDTEEIKEIMQFSLPVIKYLETLLDAYLKNHYKKIHQTAKIGIGSIVRVGRLAEGILSLSEEAREYIRLLVEYKEITDKKILLQAGLNFETLLNEECFYKKEFYTSIITNLIPLSMTKDEFRKEITSLNNIHFLISEQIYIDEALQMVKEGHLPSQVIKKYLELQERKSVTRDEVIIVLQYPINQNSSQI